jgi:hypothetical protein
MLMAHQKKKIEQYTNQYINARIFSWQADTRASKALSSDLRLHGPAAPKPGLRGQ